MPRELSMSAGAKSIEQWPGDAKDAKGEKSTSGEWAPQTGSKKKTRSKDYLESKDDSSERVKRAVFPSLG